MESAASTESILALWDRFTGSPEEEWTFWQTLAAICLSDTPISAILEESSIPRLTNPEEGGLSVIERLLVEHNCS
jgi:hypothetical protein